VRYFFVKIAGPKLLNFISPFMRDLHSYATFKNAYKASLFTMHNLIGFDCYSDLFTLVRLFGLS